MYYVTDRDGTIIGGVLTDDLSRAAAALDLEETDGCKISTAWLLTDDQIYAYLDRLPSWDYDDTVPDLMREMCSRHDLAYDDYETYDDLFYAVGERMGRRCS